MICEKLVKCKKPYIKFDFFIMLISEELLVSGIWYRSVWVVPSFRVARFRGVCPWSESLSETFTHRVNGGLIWVRAKQELKTINIDWSDNLEQIGIVVNSSSSSSSVFELISWHTRNWRGCFRSLSRRTFTDLMVFPEKIPCKPGSFWGKCDFSGSLLFLCIWPQCVWIGDKRHTHGGICSSWLS